MLTLAPSLARLSPETVQRFLDGLSALSLQHGLVLDMANVMPMHSGAGGYVLAPGGYLTTSAPGELAGIAGIRHDQVPPDARVFMAAFDSMTGHNRMRLLRDIR